MANNRKEVIDMATDGDKSVLDAPPPTEPASLTVAAAEAAAEAEAKRVMRQEYRWYHEERPGLVKREMAAEGIYHKTMVTLSGAALVFSLAVVKDWVGPDKAVGIWLVLFSWCCFGISLIIAVTDLRWTYESHQDWREILDDEFDPNNWEQGAQKRASERYETIPHIKMLEITKTACYTFLLLGFFATSIFLVVNYIYQMWVPTATTAPIATTTTTTTTTTTPALNQPMSTTTTITTTTSTPSALTQPSPATPALNPLVAPTNTASPATPTTTPTTAP